MKYKEIDIDVLLEIAAEAGDAIMEIYQRDFSVEFKNDNSPLTEADTQSNAIILKGLTKHYSDIPFISEETKQTAYEVRKHWQRFWLIDPIDGTKEFIKKNGEFTVNIALIEDGVPVVGVVNVPAQKVTYWGVKEEGAFKQIDGSVSSKITVSKHYNTKQNIRVVASRSHLNDATLKFVETLKQQGKQIEFISSGSSLKFCLVAEGKADVYPRFSPTMEWDTAAAHAVVLYAGKNVLNTETGTALVYNKENLLNPYFIVE